MKSFILFIFLSAVTATTTLAQFRLIGSGEPINIVVDTAEKSVVHEAVRLFSDDLKNVGGISPILGNEIKPQTIVVGTMGMSHYINEMVSSKDLSVNALKNEWEAFRLFIPKGHSIIIIVGSDPRGTAYGLMKLSEYLKVSPWSWWADVPYSKITDLTLPVQDIIEKPDVEYRGIFLNDEDWCLVPWSSKTFAPSVRSGEILPKTYEKIFELMLRLRLNIIQPAMHEKTVPFYCTKGNREMADRYGIVIGTSHCEPLMRNNAGEWDKNKYGAYNWLTNRDTIVSYWSKRLDETKENENFYTIGMRGVHDGRMEGTKTLEEQTKALSNVIMTQQDMLKQYGKSDAPQAFFPYKEVLNVYNNGLQVPDNVTLVWCDDNYGYITRLSNDREQRRKGGAGVYYHISYWGRPHDYLWLPSTQPALMATELRRAWNHGAKKLWILNVGDIKPSEYNISYYAALAWNVNVENFAESWSKQTFQDTNVARIFSEYYRLASIRRPEFMGWSRVEENAIIKGGKTPVTDTEFSPFRFGNEVLHRIAEYEALCKLTDSLRISSEYRDAYFELVEYPVKAATAMNKKLLYAQLARLYSKYGFEQANEYIKESNYAYHVIDSLTNRYNKIIAEGKWDRMMDMKPRNLPVFQTPELPNEISESTECQLWYNGEEHPYKSGEAAIIRRTFSGKDMSLGFTVYGHYENLTFQSPNWLKIIRNDRKHFTFKVDTKALQNGEKVKECATEIMFNIDGKNYPLHLRLKIPGHEVNIPCESDGAVALNADYAETIPALSTYIQGLGHSNRSLMLDKSTMECAEYKFYTLSDGEAKLIIATVPNHAADGSAIRYAIQIDNEPKTEISVLTEVRSEPWKIDVLRNQHRSETSISFSEPGEHRLKIQALTDDVILDQIMIDFQPNRSCYTIPVYPSN